MLTIYKASAGSGKTFTLALEYIKALLGKKNPDGTYSLADLRKDRRRHRHILAITFTNKATEEMKTRIIKELNDLCEAPTAEKPSAYALMLCDTFRCDFEALAKNAKTALEQLLFDFNFFNVSTIDSFFQLVLRTFAREVDKPGNFEIELNDYYAMSMAAAMMLRELNATEHPYRTAVGGWIKQLMEDKLDTGEKFDIFNSDGGDSGVYATMVAFLRKMNDETFKEHAEEVMQYLAEPAKIDSFRKQLRSALSKFSACITSGAREIKEYCSQAGVEPRGSKMLNSTLLNRIDDWAAGNIEWSENSKTITDIAWGAKSPLTADYAKGKKQAPPGLDTMASSLAAEFIHLITLRAIYSSVLNSIYYLGLMGHALGHIDRFRRENNLILLSDTNDLLGSVISDSETPFIYERLGVQLQHFLIDEFQDTSRMQWQNLRPLVANSEATDNDNLIIGDEKQSIYRFRNADAGLLHSRVAADFPNSHRLRGNEISENTNYRSRELIVRFNNAFFDNLAKQLNAETYGNVCQQVAKHNSGLGGHVKLISYKAPKAGIFEEFAHRYTAAEIYRFLKAGYKFSDIAILVNRRSDGEDIVNYLVAEHPDIKVASDEALLVTSNPTVRLIVSVMQLVQASRHSEDTVTNTGYATRREVGLIIKRLQYLLSRGMNLDTAIARFGDTGNETAVDTIDLVNDRRCSTLMSMVEYIESVAVDEETRERDKAFITAFNDCVADYCAVHGSDLHSFLRWWGITSPKLAIPSAEGISAVRVMTVHKSKGLQFQCVIMPYFKSSIVSKQQSDWYSAVPLEGIDIEVIPPIISLPASPRLTEPDSPLRQQAERFRMENTIDALNLTYVAFTRAISELTVIGGKDDDSTIAPWLAMGTFPQSDVEFPGDARWKPLPAEETVENAEPVEALIYESGTPTAPVVSNEEQTREMQRRMATLPAPEFVSTFRADTDIYTSLPENTQDCFDDSTDDAVSASDALTDTEERQRGEVLHRVLSLMHKADDLEHAFERVAQARRLDRTRRKEYLEILRKAFDNGGGHVDRWFRNFSHTLNERPIYLPEKKITRRPDRIIWGNDGSVEIVDFKFTAQHSTEHIYQVRQYMRLLRVMGFGNTKAYLWYLLTGDIIEVSLRERQ